MQLSVVILNYNVRYFLEQCICSVQKALENIDGEIIVVDNNSSDGSCVMMQQRFPHIKLIQNTENYGFPKGNNIGVSAAQGKYICILNPDTVVSEDTFLKVLAFAEEKQNLGIVGCKLIDGTGAFLPESKRGIPTPWVAFTKMSALYKLFPNSKAFNQYYAQHLSKEQSGEVAILVGAFMVLQRELYSELQGFDENCFMYADDIDLSYRSLLLGKSNYYFADTSVLHYKGESTTKDANYMLRFQEAMTYFYKKHFKVPFLFTILVQVGILFFALFKRLNINMQPSKFPDKYVLYSNNQNLSGQLELVFQNKVLICELKKEKGVNLQLKFRGKRVEFLLDNHYLSFKKCINIIESMHNKQYTFKILPKSSKFLIGSNSNSGRGEVVKFQNNYI
ncbi:glycosyltransferase family 2 protein [Flavobacterium sp. TMP13]|uniref:glycosyltransferase family 2 protein n=1 Tax=Flavobacterium sp. TMP13 TaxID=3425950 RepID=UPI003D77D8B4